MARATAGDCDIDRRQRIALCQCEVTNPPSRAAEKSAVGDGKRAERPFKRLAANDERSVRCEIAESFGVRAQGGLAALADIVDDRARRGQRDRIDRRTAAGNLHVVR